MLVDVSNLVGETALQHAVIFNWIEITKQFLQVKTDANKKSNRGHTVYTVLHCKVLYRGSHFSVFPFKFIKEFFEASRKIFEVFLDNKANFEEI